MGELMPSPLLALHDVVDQLAEQIDRRARARFKDFALTILKGRKLCVGEVRSDILDIPPLQRLWQFCNQTMGQEVALSIDVLDDSKQTCLMMRVPHHPWNAPLLEQLISKKGDSFVLWCSPLSLSGRAPSKVNAPSEDLLCTVWDIKLSKARQRVLQECVETLPALLKQLNASIAFKGVQKTASLDSHVDEVLAIADRQKCEGREHLKDFLKHAGKRYVERYDSSEIVDDFRVLRGAETGQNIKVRLLSRRGSFHLKLYRFGPAIDLSILVSVLGRMGFLVNAEESFPLRYASKEVILHNLTVTPEVDLCDQDTLEERLEKTLWAIFCDGEESDSFQRMVLCAGLTWQECRLLRAYSRYLKQLGVPYGRSAMDKKLVAHPRLVRQLIALFHQRLSLRQEVDQSVDPDALLADISQMIHYDEERLFRGLFHLFVATMRTNFYQTIKGRTKPYLSFKIDCRLVEDMPEPRPMFEIFVFAPFMEGVHLRSGRVSRGGLRWSDRKEDYRDEVLDLLKTQIVKNAVIVPVGAKGGFVSKDSALMSTLCARDRPDAYDTFIQGLLDLTDNMQGKTVIAPAETVCLDEPDPYLVVAADKGTATRSDDANQIAEAYRFWLGDAFASGGAHGYDHKKIGITARGAWRSVEHHFRTLGISLDTPFSVVGVGDMSGDVFGNGMLLSKNIRLRGAFDHRDIFLDPDPDPTASYKERKRLFLKKRSSWRDYDAKLISKGGGVFSRSLRMIPLSAPVRHWLGIQDAKISPDELIQCLLKAPTELLWFGGVGTFIKGANEPDIAIADSGNNGVRVNAPDVKARVIVEGANLALTPQGRVEYALAGGQINTDALDNAAGVTCSDYEVNIKILCALLEEKGKLSRGDRDALLKSMADEVVALVLKRITAQNQAVGFAQTRSAELLSEHVRLMVFLERHGFINKKQHFLPQEEDLQQRRANQKGLSRPEISILLASSKIALHKAILASDLPDDPGLESMLIDYFPKMLTERFGVFVANHPLRREIIATALSNLVCDTLGPSFVNEVFELTRAPVHSIAKAIVIVRKLFCEDKFDFLELKNLEESLLYALLGQIDITMKRLVVWFLRHEDMSMNIDALVNKYKEGFCALRKDMLSILPQSDIKALRDEWGEWLDKDFLQTYVWPLDSLMFAPDVIQVQRFVRRPLSIVARVYYQLADIFGIRWLRQQIESFPLQNDWQKKGLQEILEQTLSIHQQLTLHLLSNIKEESEETLWKAWRTEVSPILEDYKSLLDDIKCAPSTDVSPMIVLGQELRRFYERVAGTCVMTVSFT